MPELLNNVYAFSSVVSLCDERKREKEKERERERERERESECACDIW